MSVLLNLIFMRVSVEECITGIISYKYNVLFPSKNNVFQDFQYEIKKMKIYFIIS